MCENDLSTTSLGQRRINAKLHDGLCQRCKDVLEWRVKFSKYKPLSQPRKCVKCLQKTVKDAYHTVCRPCACKLNLCAKCGKEEEIVFPFGKGPEMGDESNLNSEKTWGGDQEVDEELDFNDSDEDNVDFTEGKPKEVNLTHQPSKQKDLKERTVVSEVV
ncbi:uncharacterized protein C9orf85 homolog isoform X3 [Rhinatrema bivittatum]|uniref:uncharacterized protein C9orf85 homolog isoform X3 n=1 Tax=Rhinatrema bivittatum TaxID=194408 RepID=UPI00112D21B5|nr:uncharacterized protein C9orf85 homolog isoform X3 [Rhinatrema bivittatum]